LDHRPQLTPENSWGSPDSSGRGNLHPWVLVAFHGEDRTGLLRDVHLDAALVAASVWSTACGALIGCWFCWGAGAGGGVDELQAAVATSKVAAPAISAGRITGLLPLKTDLSEGVFAGR
jgi:hypothetical protein